MSIMKPKVHLFDPAEWGADVEGVMYDQSQYRDDIEDGDVLLAPGVVAAVLFKAWPIIAAGRDRHKHEVLHVVAGEDEEGKPYTVRNFDPEAPAYEKSWQLAEEAFELSPFAAEQAYSDYEV